MESSRLTFILLLHAGSSNLTRPCLPTLPKHCTWRSESRNYTFLTEFNHSQLDMQTNVLIKSDGSAVIADFGLSLIKVDITSRSTTTLITGTKRWMAPERMRGRRLAPPMDIYAWGMTAYEACHIIRRQLSVFY
jgi:hypothetical protein